MSPPAAPVPTFFMDDFTPYPISDGSIESNISFYTTHFLSLSTSQGPNFPSTQTMSAAFCDPRSPPEHPYIRSFSANPVLAQPYIRPSQLGIVHNLSLRLNDRLTWCRNGCSSYERATTYLCIVLRFMNCPSLTPCKFVRRRPSFATVLVNL